MRGRKPFAPQSTRRAHNIKTQTSWTHAEGANVSSAHSDATYQGLRPPPPDKIAVALIVNGVKVHLQVEACTTLLDALRNHLELTSTKKGCGHGHCGAFPVLIEGRRVNSCLT